MENRLRLLKTILESCSKLHWSVVMNKDKVEDVNYLIIGQDEVVQEIMSILAGHSPTIH